MRFSPWVLLVAGTSLLPGCADQGPSDTTQGPANNSPTADFTAACDGLTCTLTDSSTDADGAIEAYAWDLGDGTTSTEQNVIHGYAAPGGQFTVTLKVTDDDGAAATVAREVNVSRENAAPLADFTVSCANLTCGFTDQSTDPDAGSLASRIWDFGDGQTSTAPNPFHTYAPPGGEFKVTLAVTDGGGAKATAVKQVKVTHGSAPDRSGTYVRETPHSVPNRHSRYVIRANGTFELHDGRGADTTVYTGRWVSSRSWGGWPMEPGSVILLDFDGHEDDAVCGGEGFGSFLLDGHMGVAYCWDMIQAGLEEGVYTSIPGSGTPGPPPPEAGKIAFVRDGRIYRANTDGSGLVQLSAGPDDRDPAWSPDGSRIAFTRTSGGTTGVFIMDADGRNVVQRTSPGRDPTWSPDGGWIAFTCWTAAEWARDICTVKVDDDAATPVTITQHGARVSEPAWSPDGTRIGFISDWAMFDFWFDIWVVAPDGSQPSALRSHTPLTPNPDEQHQPAWSPDGRSVAYLECPWAFHVCSSSVIEVMNADGAGAVRLAAASGYASPTWSPDGQLIAFASSNAIEWVSADGSRRGRIIGNGHSPAWRP